MFKTLTITALAAAILAAGVSTVSARIVTNGNTLNGGGENGNTLNGGGDNGNTLNGGGDNGNTLNGGGDNGNALNGGGDNGYGVRGVKTSGVVSTGLVVLAVELPPTQQ